VREAMRREFGTEDLSAEPRVAEWLTRHFYRPGQSVPWPEKVRRATGRPLDARALAEFLAVGPEG
jgi:Zn-dependent M32 family carboxypeptidase